MSEVTPDPPIDHITGDDLEPRHFAAGDRFWMARLAGNGAGGTGFWGLGMLHAVHFFSPDAPDKPLLEALLPRGRFPYLFDEELAALLQEARPIVIPTQPAVETGGEGRGSRRSRTDDEPPVDG
jgi:hypothetical protein